MIRQWRGALLLAALGGTSLLPGLPARAQTGLDPSFRLEVATDHRRRGLSWSDGKAAVEGNVTLDLSRSLEIGLGATALRQSRRHGGADAGLDLGARYRRDLGPWMLSLGATGHVFPGAAGLDYVEGDGSLSYDIGPARFHLGASYAPPQDAIGGDNLYLSLAADMGVPGTPLSIYGHVGRSSGRVEDAVRAARLRPQGRYWDHAVGLEHVMGRLATGLRYSGTSIGAVHPAGPYMDRHVGERLVWSLRVVL